MKELQVFDNKAVTMTSVELVDLINNFRKEEGNTTKKEHKDFMKSIRKEIAVLETAGVKDGGNFSPISYKDSYGRIKPCYQMNKAGIMQMLNKESALVRYKTQRYIEELEDRLTITSLQEVLPGLTNLRTQLDEVHQAISTQQAQIEEQREHIQYLQDKIGIRAKEKYNYGAIIKRHLKIERVNGDYRTIRDMFFHELDVKKWEDIPYSRENVQKLDAICNAYRPRKLHGLMKQVFDK